MQKQSRRKKWSSAADHPGSERQLFYPRAGRAPSLRGREVQTCGQKFQGCSRNCQALGPSGLCAHATPGAAVIQAMDPGGKLSGSSALLASEKRAEAETG